MHCLLPEKLDLAEERWRLRWSQRERKREIGKEGDVEQRKASDPSLT